MKIALSAFALLASSVGSFAADLPSREEPAAPPPPSSSVPPTFAAGLSDWSGFYAGGALVGNRASGKSSLGNASYTLPTNGAAGATNSRISQTNTLTDLSKSSDNTFGGTLFGGYNVQIDNLVYGVEADLSYFHDRSKSRFGSLAISGAYTDTAALNETSAGAGSLGISQTSRLSWDGSLRTRLGVVAAPSLLVFATGGVAVGRVERQTRADGSIEFRNDATPQVAQATHSFSSKAETNKIRIGWTVGAGADYKLTEALTMRADYRYTNFGKSSAAIKSTPTCVDGPADGTGCTQLPVAEASATTRSSDMFHAVRIGLSYQFSADILPTTIFARY